jgi:hypothetical protein
VYYSGRSTIERPGTSEPLMECRSLNLAEKSLTQQYSRVVFRPVLSTPLRPLSPDEVGPHGLEGGLDGGCGSLNSIVYALPQPKCAQCRSGYEAAYNHKGVWRV